MTRKLGSAALAISVLWALISLVIKGGIGVSQATPVSNSSDFNLNSAQVEIIHETANACVNTTFIGSPFISCESRPSLRVFCVAGFCTGRFDSDSYQILANLALSNPNDFQQDLNQSIEFALAPGNCSNIPPDLSLLPNGTWTGTIPGASLHKQSSKISTLYSFEGNIPSFLGLPPPFENVTSSSSSELFDNLQFNLFIPKFGKPTMSLQGNANLCAINGPMAFAVLLQEANPEDNDTDFACVNVHAPDLDTLDVSSAVCSRPIAFP